MIKKFFRDNLIHKKIVPYLDFIFIIPIMHLFYVLGVLSLGASAAHIYFLGYPSDPLLINYKTFLLFISVIIIYSANTILEFYFNKNEDYDNIIFVPDLSNISFYSIRLLSLAFYLIVFCMVIIISWKLIPLYILLIISSYFLSYKRKNNRIWTISDFLIYSIVTSVIIFIISWIHIFILNDSLQLFSIKTLFIALLPYLLSFISISLFVYIKELDLKKSFIDRKIPFISTVILLLAMILGLLQKDPLMSTSSIVVLPFFLYATIRHLEKDISRAVTYSIFLYIYFSFTIYPLLSIPITIIFYLCKYYNWHRFKIHYPAFVVEDDYNKRK